MLENRQPAHFIPTIPERSPFTTSILLPQAGMHKSMDIATSSDKKNLMFTFFIKKKY
jgi:hypothetical protein